MVQFRVKVTSDVTCTAGLYGQKSSITVFLHPKPQYQYKNTVGQIADAFDKLS